MKYIYEVTDVTDEEVYFSLGVFRSFLEATNAIKGDEPPETPVDHEDHATFNIRRRRLGKVQPFSQGQRVATVEWLSEYSEEKDEFLWSTPTVTLNDNNTGDIPPASAAATRATAKRQEKVQMAEQKPIENGGGGSASDCMQLLPCPFCGSNHIEYHESGPRFWGETSCMNCGASISENISLRDKNGEGASKKAWNRRAL